MAPGRTSGSAQRHRLSMECRLGDAERQMYGYNPHVSAALLSIYTHHPELLVDGETISEVRAPSHHSQPRARTGFPVLVGV
jgi:hypothetical protein